ncbi:MAG: phosphoenolpyruvate carboxykinase (GTP) [Hadesarchaea archaeon]|nr:MAG: phosphoenolpyruvate carboxykinase (GTP) [Hadesarchaea archaeon]TDA35123.1 MAG: phosphoenolpyruvate carboxykinase (GTP) [Hadesarchaea archaeon]
MSKKERLLVKVRERAGERGVEKLEAIPHPEVHEFIAKAVELCDPERIFICDDSPRDLAYIRRMALESGEERPLSTPGHTYHFDGYFDQGRDRQVTKFLVPKGDYLSPRLNQVEREEGLSEILGLLRNSMRGRTMIVRFLTLGPKDSPFTIPCMECTDSWYVAHSVSLLYRRGYDTFLKLDPSAELFKTLHSSGKVDERMISVEHEKKRIYIDYVTNTVYSVNTQYAGNSVGFKKLALRLAIRKAHREGWLAEHFMIIGVKGPGGRKTYLAGAFPSACGKTSTAMLPDETILADDIAYVRNLNGSCRAVNIEAGILGILQDVNPRDDPLIYQVLTSPGEIIFSNVLVKDGKPYWLGMGCELPKEGINFYGEWREGMVGPDGKPVPPAHPNARYTVSLTSLPNCDPELENPLGVELGGIMFGGRDYRAFVPVQQGFNWEHGIILYGAGLETETTFAIVEEPKFEINVMSIQDFLSIPLGDYIRNYLEFGRKLKKVPLVFGVNYFLRHPKTGEYLNHRLDKHVWVKWMERRIHGEMGALVSPTGLIPKHEDLVELFREIRGKEYTWEEYEQQFSIRVKWLLKKVGRVEEFWRKEEGTPKEVFEVLEETREGLEELKKRFGDPVSPRKLEEE